MGQFRQLGQTGLAISRVGFGGWAIGAEGRPDWSAADDEAAVEAILHASASGLNWIDTAPIYGRGHSEEIVGRALAQFSGQRPLVFTKASLLPGEDGRIENCLKRDSIWRECETSIERLGVDAIDLLQVHWPIPDEDIEEGWSAFAALKEAGYVRHIGVSNFSVQQLRRAGQIAPVEVLQLKYSLIAREAEEELLPYAAEQGIGVLVYSPMGAGLLTGSMTRERVEGLPNEDYRVSTPDFQEPRLSENLRLAERLGEIGARHDAGAGSVAIAWALRHPAVSSAIVGIHKANHVQAAVEAMRLELSDDDLYGLDR